MPQIHVPFISQHTAFTGGKSLHPSMHQYYVKWLRYYLDFCHKYDFQQNANESLSAVDNIEVSFFLGLEIAGVGQALVVANCAFPLKKNDRLTPTAFGQRHRGVAGALALAV